MALYTEDDDNRQWVKEMTVYDNNVPVHWKSTIYHADGDAVSPVGGVFCDG